jgi:hypothetical protein
MISGYISHNDLFTMDISLLPLLLLIFTWLSRGFGHGSCSLLLAIYLSALMFRKVATMSGTR